MAILTASSVTPRSANRPAPFVSVSHDWPAPSRRATLAGRILSGLGVAFLVFDASFKLLNPQAVDSGNGLGYPVHVLFGIGVLQAALLAIYLIPRTALLGAILWTGYFGGAIASHVRLENPWFSHTLFPVYIAALLWLGLWLRDARARALTTL